MYNSTFIWCHPFGLIAYGNGENFFSLAFSRPLSFRSFFLSLKMKQRICLNRMLYKSKAVQKNTHILKLKHQRYCFDRCVWNANEMSITHFAVKSLPMNYVCILSVNVMYALFGCRRQNEATCRMLNVFFVTIVSNIEHPFKWKTMPTLCTVSWFICAYTHTYTWSEFEQQKLQQK